MTDIKNRIKKRKEEKGMKKEVVKWLFAAKKNERPSLKMNLQHFAKSEEEKEENDDSDDEQEDGEGDDDLEQEEDGEDNKKFTQEDMTKLATKEKKQGRRSAFREMGFKDESEAKKQLGAFREWQKSQLSDGEKHQQEIDNANTATSEAEKRAQEAEEKLAVVIAGVRKDSIDDVLSIARTKVTEDETLDDVLASMKKEDRYKSFFAENEDSGSSGGTGSNLNHRKKQDKKDNIGARLAKAQMANGGNKKNSYFN